MGLIVQKFGGTSVGSPERIRSVADRIARTRKAGHQLVVVVSAMGHTTDELIDLAQKVSVDPPGREMDMLLTAGERISMALLSMALADREIPALSLTGSQSGIITDGAHRRARIRRILGDRVRSALSRDQVVIVAGFQGVSEAKEITTLGRGGSDTTAVALAGVLQADACEIYTDVDGVFSADPRIVPEAKIWPKISHNLMVELATRGAGVLHPRSVELAKQNGTKLRVLNSLREGSGGTEIVTEKGMEEFRVVGITADSSKIRVSVELMRPSVVTAVWDRAAEAHLSLVVPQFRAGTLEFFAEADAMPEWKKLLQSLASEGFVKTFELDPSLIPLSIIGDRFAQDGAALSEVLETLAQSGTPVTMGSASALGLTVAVPRTHAEDGVRALHRKFFGGEEAKT